MVFTKISYFTVALIVILMSAGAAFLYGSNSVALNVVDVNTFEVKEDVLTLFKERGKSYSKTVRMNYKIVIQFRIINNSDISCFYIVPSAYSSSIESERKAVVDFYNTKNDWVVPEIVEIKAKKVYSGKLEIAKEDMDISCIRISAIVLDKVIKNGTPIDFYRYIEANKIKIESEYYEIYCKTTSGKSEGSVK